MREASRDAASEREAMRASRLRPDGGTDHGDGRVEVRVAEAVAAPDDSGSVAADPPARTNPAPVPFSNIPWTASGPFSLNPLPRYAARLDLDWRQ